MMINLLSSKESESKAGGLNILGSICGLSYDFSKVKISFKEIFNAEVLFREDCSADEFIDVIVGNRVYMPCLYVKI